MEDAVSIILKTERLHLRRIEEVDLISLGRIYADPECMRFYPDSMSPSETAHGFKSSR
jgi:RimJ/RimL family protein N-acetyltransferase